MTLSTGLRSSIDVYGYDSTRQPSDADLAKYRKYVQLATRAAGAYAVDRADNDGSLRAFSRLKPIYEFSPSLFTVDSVFSVCFLHIKILSKDIGYRLQTEFADIPKRSMQMYEEAVRRRSFEVSPAARALYDRFIAKSGRRR